MNPENVHENHTRIGVWVGKYSITRDIIKTALGTPKTHYPLAHFGGIQARGRVGLSAGFDYNAELTDILPSVGFGFASVGTITLEPYQGNPSPRLVRLAHSKSILVNKGLKGWGAKKVIQNLEKKVFTIPVGISIASTNKQFGSLTEQIEDIIGCFKLFENSKVQHSYYELNISCPNLNPTVSGVFYNTHNLEELLKQLKSLRLTKPMWVKMPITLSDQETLSIVELCYKYGIKTFVTGNLQTDRALLTEQEQIKIKKLRGNLSGKPTHTRALELVKVIKSSPLGSNVEVVGVGGILEISDAQEFMNAGASAVMLITGMIFNSPHLINDIQSALTK